MQKKWKFAIFGIFWPFTVNFTWWTSDDVWWRFEGNGPGRCAVSELFPRSFEQLQTFFFEKSVFLEGVPRYNFFCAKKVKIRNFRHILVIYCTNPLVDVRWRFEGNGAGRCAVLELFPRSWEQLQTFFFEKSVFLGNSRGRIFFLQKKQKFTFLRIFSWFTAVFPCFRHWGYIE